MSTRSRASRVRQSMLASGDVFYSNAKNASIMDSLIFRYGP